MAKNFRNPGSRWRLRHIPWQFPEMVDECGVVSWLVVGGPATMEVAGSLDRMGGGMMGGSKPLNEDVMALRRSQ